VVLAVGLIGLVLSASGCSSRSAPVVAARSEKEAAAPARPVQPVKAAARVARARADDKDKEAAAPFRLPDDEGGALLSKVLAPRQRRGPLPGPGRQRRSTQAPNFEPREPPLPRPEVAVPRLVVPRPKSVLRPHLVTEEELAGPLDAPAVPQRPTFHAGARARFASDDPEIPPPLPVLARPVPDRAPLDDATTEASAEAALAAPLPERTTPAPYQRLAVPDPYENRRPLSLPLPPEGEEPISGAPAPPK
jgi:hypothetical protein